MAHMVVPKSEMVSSQVLKLIRNDRRMFHASIRVHWDFQKSLEHLILGPRIFILGTLKSETISRESHLGQNLRDTFVQSRYWGLSCSVGVCDEYSAECIKVMLCSAQEAVDGRQLQ